MNKKFSRFMLICLFNFSVAHAYDGTVIGSAAAALQPGEWIELQTNGLDEAIISSGADHNLLTWSFDGKWNPGTKELFYIGGDHGGAPQEFISYSAENNTWVIEPRPPWMSSGPNMDHAYDYNAIDTENEIYYYVHFRYDIKQKTWLPNLPRTGLPSFGRAHLAVEYFSGVGLVIVGDGGVYLYNGGSSWKTIKTGIAFAGLHPIAEYNPKYRFLIFGGGDGTDAIYRLDKNLNIIPMGNTPLDYISASSGGVIFTTDPVSGNYLVIDRYAKFYEFDAVNDNWSVISNSLPQFTKNSPSVNDLIATPIENYGVVMIAQHVPWDAPDKVWLYKHKESNRDTLAPDKPKDFNAE